MSTTYRRPDGRLFVAPDDLIDAVSVADEPIYLNCDLANVELVATCERLGMRTEIESTSFRVPFDGALALLPDREAARGYELTPADQTDTGALCRLDTDLRQHVPGTNGWRGNQEWFDAELALAEFDPTGYFVASDSCTNELVGLIRFWRNQAGPALGLLAVLPEHQGGFLTAVLFRQGLLGARGWGSDHFTTNTARPALQRRLLRSGGQITGRFAQMVFEVDSPT